MQVVRRNDGSYETRLIWKVGHPSLPNNKSGSLASLSGLMRKLEREPDFLEKYNNIIQEQIAEGIVEPVTDPAEVDRRYSESFSSNPCAGERS